MRTNKNGPLFISCPTYRNYSEYHDAEQYYKGWNDAMRYIFGEDKEEKEGKISLVRGKDESEKSKSEIVPDFRDGWSWKEGEAE